MAEAQTIINKAVAQIILDMAIKKCDEDLYKIIRGEKFFANNQMGQREKQAQIAELRAQTREYETQKRLLNKRTRKEPEEKAPELETPDDTQPYDVYDV